MGEAFGVDNDRVRRALAEENGIAVHQRGEDIVRLRGALELDRLDHLAHEIVEQVGRRRVRRLKVRQRLDDIFAHQLGVCHAVDKKQHKAPRRIVFICQLAQKKGAVVFKKFLHHMDVFLHAAREAFGCLVE